MKTKTELIEERERLIFRDWWPYLPEDKEQLDSDIAELTRQINECEAVIA